MFGLSHPWDRPYAVAVRHSRDPGEYIRHDAQGTGRKNFNHQEHSTGVVDRLEAKKLVKRIPSEHDGRSQIVQLTKKGEAMFDKVFPAHLTHLGQIFANFNTEDYTRIKAALQNLRAAFESSGA